jgi:hypothetical protein
MIVHILNALIRDFNMILFDMGILALDWVINVTDFLYLIYFGDQLFKRLVLNTYFSVPRLRDMDDCRLKVVGLD